MIDKMDNEQKRCASIKSKEERGLQCLFKPAANSKYCSMHLLQKDIIDYQPLIHEIKKDMDQPVEVVRNPIFRRIDLLKSKKCITHPIQTSKDGSVIKEQKVDTITNSHQENEDDLEVKLLILANDNEYVDKIPKLIGPVFDDVTLSEDQYDPITMDPIWMIVDRRKVASSVNKYFLFSYRDSQNKVRCFTIFTMQEMIKSGELSHPVIMEPIPEESIQRAKELIDLYSTKLGLFQNVDEKFLTPQYKLRNRLINLFKRFHVHSIYLEEKWLLDINTWDKLDSIVTKTDNLVRHNLNLPANCHIFRSKMPRPSSSYNDDNLIDYKMFIVTEWEKLINTCQSPQDQVPIWILVSGLSFVVPEIKQKFPNLQVMFD